MGIGAEEFQKGEDIYAWYGFEDVFVRWDAAANRFFRKFVGNDEVEVEWGVGNLLMDAFLHGEVCSGDEYKRGEPLATKE